MAGSTFIYTLFKKKEGKKKYVKNSFFKFQLTHVFLNNLQSIYNLRSQVFLEIVTPSRENWFQTDDEWRFSNIWGCGPVSTFCVLRCQVFFFFLSNQLIYFSMLSSLLLLVLILTKIESGGYTFLPRCCLLCVCFLCAVLAPFCYVCFQYYQMLCAFYIEFQIKKRQKMRQL